MLIIGERINTSREEVFEAVEKRDIVYIKSDVKAQVEAGANIIDINAGSRAGSELNDLNWLIDIIQDMVPVRLSLDCSDPQCLLETTGRVHNLPMLNSTTAEKSRFEKMVPVIEKRECEVVALCMDDRGIPKTVDQVLENAEKLVKDLEYLGVKRERIYLDPLVQAISTDPRAGLRALVAIDRIKMEYEKVNVICGLSNISYALPRRSIINRAFLSMAVNAGLSAAIMDPLDKKMMGALEAALAIVGADEYCLDYIRAFREGRLEE